MRILKRESFCESFQEILEQEVDKDETLHVFGHLVEDLEVCILLECDDSVVFPFVIEEG